MRFLPVAAALGVAFALSACVYVERTVPAQPARVYTAPPGAVVAPGVVTTTPPPAVVVR